MYDPNRQREFMELMRGSIAPLPEAPQFVPMQPMEVAPMQDSGPSPISSAIGQIGTALVNREDDDEEGQGWQGMGNRMNKYKMPTKL